MDTFNKFLVGSGAGGIVINRVNALLKPLTAADALNLAAWLVAVAATEPQGGERATFEKLLREIEAT